MDLHEKKANKAHLEAHASQGFHEMNSSLLWGKTACSGSRVLATNITALPHIRRCLSEIPQIPPILFVESLSQKTERMTSESARYLPDSEKASSSLLRSVARFEHENFT